MGAPDYEPLYAVYGGNGLRRLADGLTHEDAIDYRDRLEGKCEADGFQALQTLIVRSN